MSSSDPHPAFPTAQQHQPVPIPSSAQGLWDIVNNTPNPETVINVLHKVAEGTNQAGRDKDAKARKAEEVLCLSQWNIETLDDQALQQLTGAAVFVLSARSKSEEYKSKSASNEILEIACRLCNIGQPYQFAQCLNRVGDLAMEMVSIARYLKKEAEVVPALYNLLQRSAPPGIFTAIHTALLEAILLARKCFGLALGVIETIFTDFRTARPTYQSILTYYLHAGTITAAQGRYEKARNLFTIAVVAPSQGVSAIQQQCAKRAILCEVIVSGKVIKFPRYTSPSVGRLIDKDKSIEAYLRYARYYEQGDWTRVSKMASASLFKDDKNEGLARKVMASMYKKRIRDIGEVYTKVKLHDLTYMLGYRDATGYTATEAVLMEMIAAGEINADISQEESIPSRIITFSDSEDPASTARSLAELKQLDVLSQFLEKQVTTAYREIGSSEAYVKKQWESSRARNSATGGQQRPDDAEAVVMNERGSKGKGGKVGMDLGDEGY